VVRNVDKALLKKFPQDRCKLFLAPPIFLLSLQERELDFALVEDDRTLFALLPLLGDLSLAKEDAECLRGISYLQRKKGL